MDKFLAIDLGAESGRAILGSFERDILSIKEINRFQDKRVNLFGHLYWNIYDIYDNILKSLSIYAKENNTLNGFGIDTWGVDFVFLDKAGNLIGLPNMYRDRRTEGVPEKVYDLIPKWEIFKETGIQFMRLNSLYQLYSFKLEHPDLFDYVDKVLFIPDYLNYLLTGEKINEYTISTTSQLYNPVIKDWSKKILELLGFSKDIFYRVSPPGKIIGKALLSITSEIGLDGFEVILPACHDTGSAILSVPATETEWAYLSSGTWSLIGIEIKTPIINKDTFDLNFTNEGGVFETIRFLKNVIGLWVLQECRRNWSKDGKNFDYPELISKAKNSAPFQRIIIPDCEIFLSPDDMPKAINQFLKETGQSEISDKFSIVRIILECLALKYKEMIELLNKISGRRIKVLHIIGGGSKNDLLNQMTANATGIPVVAGPSEATAIGNLLMQAYSKGIVSDITTARKIVKNSFELKYFEPEESDKWDEAFIRYNEIKARAGEIWKN